MNIKKLLLPILLVVVIGGYIIYQKFTGPNSAPIINNNQSDNLVPLQTKSSSQNNNNSNNPSTQQPTDYKDGSYTGDAINAIFGPVQVKTVISGGRITDIQFLQYPKDRAYSAELSSRVMPILKSEAIQSQSANVDVVSGTTQTSQGFSQSLQSALSKAS